MRCLIRYGLVSLFVVVGGGSSIAAERDDSGWRAVIHDHHRPMIDAAATRASALLARIEPDAYGRDELPKIRTLLAAPTDDKTMDTILGTWRCASTQIEPRGIYAYPPFRCDIELTDDGTLAFRKTTGSQRRNGQLWPDELGRWILLGGKSVNDDPYRDYSATLSDADGEDLEADTVGLLETLKDGRLRIILDADVDNVELYTLSR
jgi:hypothetical protein